MNFHLEEALGVKFEIKQTHTNKHIFDFPIYIVSP